MGDKTLSLETSSGVARLTLRRPDAGNPVDARLVRELIQARETIADDNAVRVVLLSAEGDVFSRGWDWDALLGETTDPVAALRSHSIPPDPFGCLSDLPQPIVCALNGDAIGAGLELALACDVRIAAEGARFSVPEVSMGLLPIAGGTQRLPRLVGRGKGLEMILTGETVTADEALRIGLVSAVVRRERLAEEAELVAQRIARRGPLAVRYAKEAVSHGIEMPLEQALRFESDLTIILQTTEDRAEGVKAFLEKRTPEFQGQ